MEFVLSLLPLLAQDPGLDKAKLFVYDAGRGMTLRVGEDGKVDVTVTEEREGKKEKKSYSAASPEEFRKKHPEALVRHGLGRYLAPALPQPQDDAWGDWRKIWRLPEPRFFDPFGDEDIERFFDDPEDLFDDLRMRLWPLPMHAPLPHLGGGPPVAGELGIMVDGVDETLRGHLGLKDKEGLAVGDIKPGSVAERAGLMVHDIILKADGKAVGDRLQFRNDVKAALAKAEFTLEIIRGGKKETLKVAAPKPPEKK